MNKQVKQVRPRRMARQAMPTGQVKQGKPVRQVKQGEPIRQVKQGEPVRQVKQTGLFWRTNDRPSKKRKKRLEQSGGEQKQRPLR